MSANFADYTFYNAMEPDIYPEMLAWLEASSPPERHRCVLGWNYDYWGWELLARIVSRDDCDLGTAVRALWGNQPAQVMTMPSLAGRGMECELIGLICDRGHAGFYAHRSLSSAGRPDDDELRRYDHEARKGHPPWVIPEIMTAPVKGTDMEPFLHGIPSHLARKYNVS